MSYVDSFAIDLLDRDAALAALRAIDPTHIFYTSWVRGSDEDENIRLNGAMLRTVLDGVVDRGNLRHVGIVTGTKHYLGPFEDYGKVDPVTPFREDTPRLPKKNFYYELEDVVADYAARYGFGWTVHRSHTIVGHAVGNLMNIGATLAAYASICKATGHPFRFPGSPVAYRGINDITDARILARQIAWAGTAPAAQGEAFNAVNGDVFRWEQLWQRIADYFEVPVAAYPGHASSLEQAMQSMGPDWNRLVVDHGLQPIELHRLASPWHTNLDLGRPMECLHSTAKLRRFGFRETQDTERSFIDLFDQLRAERIIP